MVCHNENRPICRTIIDPLVEKKEFMGKEYLVLKVKYEEWYWKRFFVLFWSKTYAMEIYHSYHDETKTMEKTLKLKANLRFTVESKSQKSEPGT
jgi:hypothetical protein